LIWNESKLPAVTVRFDISILPSPFVGENPHAEELHKMKRQVWGPQKGIKMSEDDEKSHLTKMMKNTWNVDPDILVIQSDLFGMVKT